MEVSQRVITELRGLINVADKERSGILGTMEEGLLPFKNAAVVERCSSSDFTPEDLRGRLTAESVKSLGLDQYPASQKDWDRVRENPGRQDWTPVSVYLIGSPATGKAFHGLTVLFLEACARTLVSWGPGESPRSGAQLGPSATCFVLDDFAVLSADSFSPGRPGSGQVQRCLLFADSHGLRPDRQKVFPRGAKHSGRILSGQAGSWYKQSGEFRTDSPIVCAVPLGSGQHARTKQVLLVSGFMNRPLWITTPMYFNAPELAVKAAIPPAG